VSQTKAQLLEGKAANIEFSAGTAALPAITFTGDVNTGIFSPTADTIAFAEGGVESARIDSSGRLLVGTSSARSNVREGTDNETPKIQFESATNDYSEAGLSVINNSSSGFAPQIWLGRSASDSIGGNALVSSGRIGSISFNAADGTNFIQGARIQADIDGTSGSGDLPTRLTFSTTADGAASPTEHVRLTQAGGFKVSTNGTYSPSAVSVSEYYQTNNAEALFVRAVNASYTSGCFEVAADRNTSNNSYYFIRASVTGVAYRFNVADSGNCTNTNNSYTGISDIKLKENVVDADFQWNDIKSLQVRNYNFKEETGQPTHRQIGLIAQEVELISPGLVDESIDRDPEGNDLGTVTKSVNYSVLYMKAVKALQEAMERIEVLEQRLTDAGIA
jgi:hypothetical protein